MTKTFQTITAAIAILASTAAHAQISPAGSQLIDELITYAAESDDEDALSNAETTCHYLEDLMNNKININTSNISELRRVPFVTDQQILQISEYKSANGNIMSMGELKGLPNMPGPRVMEMYGSFLKTGDSENADTMTIRQMIASGRHTISASMKSSTTDAGCGETYDGGMQTIAIRYRFSSRNHIAWGFTAEKDPGEKIRFGQQKYGFDFNSMYLKIENMGAIDRIIIGDYSAKFGQGLIMGGGISMWRYISASSIAGTENTIHEHSSCAEYNYYRGAAARIRRGPIDITALASINLADATCYDSTTFSTLRSDGYHRNIRELSRKNNLRQSDIGLMAHYTHRIIKIGAAIHGYSFSKTYQPRLAIKNSPIPPRAGGMEISTSYRIAGKNISLSGETAIDQYLHTATANTLHLSPIPAIRMSMLYRRYSHGYYAFRASGPGASSHPTNEQGIYMGISASPSKNIAIDCWADIYKFPWATTLSREPSGGHEYMIQIKIQATRQSCIYLKAKTKARTKSNEPLDIQESSYIMCQLKNTPTATLTLTTQAQWSRCSNAQDSGNGYLILQNAQWTSPHGIWKIAARYALYSAPYGARIYATENDISQTFAAPAYYRSGSRYYLLAGVKILNRINLEARIARWSYGKNETSIYAKYTFQKTTFKKNII